MDTFIIIVFTKHHAYSKTFPSQIELCIKILSDILNLLFQFKENNIVYNDINEIMLSVLRTVIQSHINMDRESPYAVRSHHTTTSQIFIIFSAIVG